MTKGAPALNESSKSSEGWRATEKDLHNTGRRSVVADTLQLFSHDIRSAMSDVLGGLRLIDGDRLDAETRAQLERVLVAGDTLAAMVDAALMAAAGETLIKSDDTGMALAP